MRRIARVLELEEQLPRKPGQLSGGQRQRVAMGRAMIREPYAYLMDEPLSNLDAKLRTQMRAEIGLLHKELGVTTIYVTHDQVEAMTLGERVAVMRRGELQQVAAPQELYNRPANLFVAGFIGSPAMNFFLGRVSEEPDRVWVSFGDGQRLEVDEHERSLAPALAGMDGKGLIVGVRPEHLQDAALVSGAPANRRLKGLVKLRELLGSEVVVHFEVQAAPVVTDAVLEIAEDVDESALSELDHRRQERRTHFVGRFGVDSPSKDGETAEIAVAAGALRFFDLESGPARRLIANRTVSDLVPIEGAGLRGGRRRRSDGRLDESAARRNDRQIGHTAGHQKGSEGTVTEHIDGLDDEGASVFDHHLGRKDFLFDSAKLLAAAAAAGPFFMAEKQAEAAIRASTSSDAAIADPIAKSAVDAAKQFSGATLTKTNESGLQALDDKNFTGPLWEKLTGVKVRVIEKPFAEIYSTVIAEHIARSGAIDSVDGSPVWVPDFAERQVLAPIDSYIRKYKAQSTMNDYHPLFRPMMKYKGKQYGFFDDGDVWILYYRKDVFNNAKLKSAYRAKFGKALRVPRGWDEFSETAQFITDQLAPQVYGTGLGRTARQPGQPVLLLPAVPLERWSVLRPEDDEGADQQCDRRADDEPDPRAEQGVPPGRGEARLRLGLGAVARGKDGDDLLLAADRADVGELRAARQGVRIHPEVEDRRARSATRSCRDRTASTPARSSRASWRRRRSRSSRTCSPSGRRARPSRCSGCSCRTRCVTRTGSRTTGRSSSRDAWPSASRVSAKWPRARTSPCSIRS